MKISSVKSTLEGKRHLENATESAWTLLTVSVAAGNSYRLINFNNKTWFTL
jgi:hypothetical protein